MPQHDLTCGVSFVELCTYISCSVSNNDHTQRSLNCNCTCHLVTRGSNFHGSIGNCGLLTKKTTTRMIAPYYDIAKICHLFSLYCVRDPLWQ